MRKMWERGGGGKKERKKEVERDSKTNKEREEDRLLK